MATQGLFNLLGPTPEEVRAQYEAGLSLTPAQMGQQSLLQQVASTIAGGGAGLGYGLGRMMGGAAPGETEAVAQQEVLRQAQQSGLSGSALYKRLAQTTADPRRALAFGQMAAEMEREEKLQEMQMEKAEFDIGTVRGQKRLRDELAKLPEKATAEDVLSVSRRFGSPDQVISFAQKQIQAQASARAKAELEADKARERAELQRERLEAQAQRTRETNELRAQLAQAQLESRQATTALQQQLAQQRIDDLKAKADERQREQKQEERALKVKQQLLVGQTQKMITRLGEAKDVVGTFSTGVQGLALSLIGGTPANTLANRLATIKANVGFDRLQAMREASPTGGALGQVAVQELFSLQAAEGSLDQNQSPEELTKNLNAIEQHYKTLQRIFSGDMTEEEAAKLLNTQPPPPGAPAAPSGSDWSIKKKVN